MNRAMILTEG